jgi:hypothetical protein
MSIGKSTDTSTDRTLTTPNWETIPCVQYGFPEGKGPKRSARLNTIFDPIPEGANTASPIYLVPQERYKQQRDNENPHRVSGDYNSLATEVQDECENDDSKNRVLYPFHVESDEYLTEGPETLIRWIREFVEDRLELPFQTCTLYFSGNRSIHAHIPRIIQSDGIAPLKELAETFCEETGAKLDCGIYSRKRLFRLPGVIHQTTGFRKIQIQPEWDEDRLRQALSRTPDVRESYEAVLRYVFLSQPSTPIDYTPDDIFRSLKGDETLLDLPRDEPAVEVETPLIERTKENLEDASEVPEWSMYNSKEFSPYALASGNPRSVAALKIKGGPFARKEKRNGATMVPAYFYGARGCAGEKYTKDQVHAPLQLSRKDYGKWDYEAGETIVIIGGQNRTSIILRVSSLEAIVVGHALTGDEGSRDRALEYLSGQGYDTGTSGPATSGSEKGSVSKPGENKRETGTIWPARKNAGTDVEALQWKAEHEGIGTLSHGDRIGVACRFLQNGWEPTWDWFKEQFGSAFKPDVTWGFLKGIVEEPGFEEYDHVEVPSRPE